ncbi:MAG: Asp-tRNA(Asn)/Glu-tRNA(Gln) amidotransferase subunit GatC [Flavobacteriia bacterium]|nr:Asp-tRNA(Asn)/Glu-tRNA(Gln) amidotransferase subunit GatC [Flavobacteriia bacterium]NBX38216.1 Asp-tRNA(Asn)/Glu-tRNA(Gln) amidotransferase subunit GatC [Flavobacteriia bacterium]
MQIDDALIDHLSHLSRLKFEGKDRENLKNDLDKIVQFLQKLNEVDTDHVEPLIFMSQEVNFLRKDEISSEITKSEALLNAPKKDSDYFRVSKVRGKHNA